MLLGKLQPEFFPSVFGPEGNESLDVGVVHRKFARLVDEVSRATGQATSAQEIAEGFLSIAVENMANAIKKVSVQRGYDIARYTLVCFGGAGGQHACLVADRLGIYRAHVHPPPRVLPARSADGQVPPA